MPEPHRRRIDVMLEPSYLDGIAERSIDEVREIHDELLEVETEVSYVRRLTHARIDLVAAELDRREHGGSVSDLVEMLPSILSDDSERSDPASSRLPRHLAPSMEITWRRGLEHLLNDTTLMNLPTIPHDDLRNTRDQLEQLERDVSQRRRALHRVIDTVEAELATRHKAERA